MQVFTTIYFAETLREDTLFAEKPNFDQDQQSLDESEQSLRERIAVLEIRDWFVDDGFGKE